MERRALTMSSTSPSDYVLNRPHSNPAHGAHTSGIAALPNAQHESARHESNGGRSYVRYVILARGSDGRHAQQQGSCGSTMRDPMPPLGGIRAQKKVLGARSRSALQRAQIKVGQI